MRNRSCMVEASYSSHKKWLQGAREVMALLRHVQTNTIGTIIIIIFFPRFTIFHASNLKFVLFSLSSFNTEPILKKY